MRGPVVRPFHSLRSENLLEIVGVLLDPERSRQPARGAVTAQIDEKELELSSQLRQRGLEITPVLRETVHEGKPGPAGGGYYFVADHGRDPASFSG
jgi:hypothetical protein